MLWLQRGGHGGQHRKNGSQVKVENQDSLLEVLPYLRMPLAYMAKNKLLAKIWVSIQVVAFVLLLSVSCRAAWVEREMERRINVLREDVNKAQCERDAFIKRQKLLEERP